MNVCSTSHAATGSARGRQHRQPAALLKGKKQNGPLQDPFSPPASQLAAMQNAPPGIQQVHPAWNKMALFRAQVSPACYESVRGCRCEYRHPT
jgi:hypothetical protein